MYEVSRRLRAKWLRLCFAPTDFVSHFAAHHWPLASLVELIGKFMAHAPPNPTNMDYTLKSNGSESSARLEYNPEIKHRQGTRGDEYMHSRSSTCCNYP
jgi:hypothetical protein